ncbi:MAG: hypothetical protein DMG79_13520 [Acidobacteria bacterium]|nr:MAG: hypothetical protein DMG79_13520 [Acidobacteriota bacterium]
MKRAPKSLWILVSLLCFAALLKANLPRTSIGSWTAASSLSQARSNASAALLSDGRILIAGGDSGSGPLTLAESFGSDGTVSSAAAMNVARSRHFAVVLNDGRVLVGGGTTTGGGAINTAEIYDPLANSWSQINTLTQARASATAALLQDGRVVIAGGDNAGVPNNSLEIYDPSSGNFSFAGTLSASRTQHAMAVLQDGRVLIVGGFDGTNPLASSDIFDPASGSVSAGPNLATARYAQSATTLLNGDVAVIGGAGTGNNGTVDLASVEIFDPTANAFTTASATLTTAREGHQAFVLPRNNSVLIVGGTSSGTSVAASELFTPQVNSTSGAWTYAAATTGSNVTARSAATGSAMQQDGLLLAAGGTDASGNTLDSTELYAFPTVKTDQSDYPPGTTVNITGAGFTPGETVNITMIESPLIDTHGPYTVTADQNGNIADSSFTTDSHDLSVRFWLSAVGSTSGIQAQNTFTDNNITVLSAPSGVTFSVTWTGFVSAGCTGTIQGGPTTVPGISSSGGSALVTRDLCNSRLLLFLTRAGHLSIGPSHRQRYRHRRFASQIQAVPILQPTRRTQQPRR